jgi:hypothetical protein
MNYRQVLTLDLLARIVLHPSGNLIIDGRAIANFARPIWMIANRCDETAWFAPMEGFALFEDAWRYLDREQRLIEAGRYE